MDRLLRLIIIEDDKRLGESLVETLKVDPLISVGVAADATEGGRMARHEPKVVVLADLGLPDAKGTEVIEALKVVMPGTPIIAFTGHSNLTEPSLRAGAAAVVIKGSEQSYGAKLVKVIRDVVIEHDLALAAAPAKLANERVNQLIDKMCEQIKGDSVNIQPG